MRVATVVGARPQFIKAAPVSSALRSAGHREILVHTGQHYDHGMSAVFFDELAIPEPDVNLGIGSGSHAAQTGRMLEAIERVLLDERPDAVVVYGDTNSTLAGALAACKLGTPLAHVEAGLRSFNRAMPEEHNRVLTDHCAEVLLCPTVTAVRNLAREGITAGVHLVGDTMYDAVVRFADVAAARSTALEDLRLEPRSYALATVHRAYNTDDAETLRRLVGALEALPTTVVFPVHPRTRARLAQLGLDPASEQLRLIEPVGYLDMLVLERNARVVLTDSGGMQKEAYFLGVPCVTLRPETEWVETVEAGWNVVAGTDPGAIVAAAARTDWPVPPAPAVFGAGDAADRIVNILAETVATRAHRR
jgi:UDP-N-acetylglucosamine 2-epimerase